MSWLSVKDYAELTGKSRQAVLKAISKGKLVVREVHGRNQHGVSYEICSEEATTDNRQPEATTDNRQPEATTDNQKRQPTTDNRQPEATTDNQELTTYATDNHIVEVNEMVVGDDELLRDGDHIAEVSKMITALSPLPAETSRELYTASGRGSLNPDTELELKDLSLANMPVVCPMDLELSPKKDRLAKLRAGMLIELESYKKANQIPILQAKEQFLSMYNKGLICEELFALDGEISMRTLARREQEYKLANKDYRVLAPAYAPRKETSALKGDVDQICALLFTDRKITIGEAILKWKWDRYTRNGKTPPVSDRTMRRAVEREIEANRSAWDLRQKGEKWFAEHRLPTLLQDLSVFKLHDQWQTDGKLLNLMVINPFTGKPARPHICAFVDVYSTMPVGMSFDWTENSMMIQEAYFNAINFARCVPETIKQDNGSGFVSASTLGEKDDVELQGIYYRSGVKEVTMHRAYNAKGKSTVERMFGVFTGQFEAFLKSYVGRSVAGKPASMSRNEAWVRKLEDRQALTVQELKASLEYYILGQYASQEHPRIKGKSRGQVYAEATQSLPADRIVKPEHFLYLLRTITRKVDNNGITIKGIQYYGFELADYVGMPVKVRYGLLEDRYVLVYTQDEQFICQAMARILTHPNAKMAGELEQGIVRHQVKAVRHHLSRYKKAVVAIQQLSDSNLAIQDESQRANLITRGSAMDILAEISMEEKASRDNNPTRKALAEIEVEADGQGMKIDLDKAIEREESREKREESTSADSPAGSDLLDSSLRWNDEPEDDDTISPIQGKININLKEILG